MPCSVRKLIRCSFRLSQSVSSGVRIFGPGGASVLFAISIGRHILGWEPHLVGMRDGRGFSSDIGVDDTAINAWCDCMIASAPSSGRLAALMDSSRPCCLLPDTAPRSSHLDPYITWSRILNRLPFVHPSDRSMDFRRPRSSRTAWLESLI